VVIGRHVNPEWHDNAGRLRRLPTPFDWHTCALCRPAPAPEPSGAATRTSGDGGR
jgi:hypothetical protein